MTTPSPQNPPPVLVTGGNGYVGRNLVRELTARGHAVRALVRSDAAEDAVSAAGARDAVRGELSDVDTLTAAMRGRDVVYHVASMTSLFGRYADFARANVEGTAAVIAAARAAGVRRIVYVSTEMAISRRGLALVDVDEAVPLPARADGPYAQSKNQAERLLNAAHGDGVETTIVRPHFVWGRDDTHMMLDVIEAIEAGEWVWIGDGTHLTSSCHVRNLVEALILAAGHPAAAGRTYFVGDGGAVEFKPFVNGLLATQGVESPEKSLPKWFASALAATLAGVSRVAPVGGLREPKITSTLVRAMGEATVVDDGLIRRELGYRPVLTREEGVAEMVAAGPVPRRAPAA